MTEPRAWFDTQREASRIFWHHETDSWYVTGFDDVWALSADSRLAARRLDRLANRLTPQQRSASAPLFDFMGRWPMSLDPPRHTASRRLLRQFFSTAERHSISTAVTEQATILAPGATEDLLGSVIRPACEAGLGALLGLDQARLTTARDLSHRIMAFGSGPHYSPERTDQAMAALEDLNDLTACLRQERPAGRLSELLNQSVAQGHLSEKDAVAHIAQLLTGTLEPTASVVATALEHLSRQPSLLDDFTSSPNIFIDEMIRLTSPFQYVARHTTQDLDIADATVPSGSRLVLVLSSANRDPDRFPDPLAFRMDRGRPPHIAFGRGRHACAGAATATMIIAAVLAVLAESATHPEFSVKTHWNSDLGMRMVHQINRMPVSGPPHRAGADR